MSLLQNETLEKNCQKLLEQKGIRFAGVINRLGNLVAGGFGPGITPIESKQKQRMLYMQMQLDISMRRDFDDSLGPVEHIISQRKNALMISVPLHDGLLLISADPYEDARKIISDAAMTFSGGTI